MVDYIMLEEYAKDKSVLFVEDDENIIKETVELLELIFHNVDIARNGEEGILKYQSFKNENSSFYDLVITDIQMPKINGVEFAKLIYKANKEQLLIVLSAHSESHYLLELVNIGISHFVSKPLEYDSFVHVLYTKLKDLDDNLKEKENKFSKEIIINEHLKWNKELKQLYLNNEIFKLTKKELLFFEILLKYREQTHTIDELLNFLWANDKNNAPDIKNLKNLISRLRKKLPDIDIENIYGFGYRINLK